MTQAMSNLDQDDMLAIVAYLASVDPWRCCGTACPANIRRGSAGSGAL
jgi:hypothetical protein